MTSKLVTIAQIKGAHGVKGEVRLRSYTAQPEACFAYGPLLDEAGKVLITPMKWRPVKDGFVVTIKEALSREEVEALRGFRAYAQRDALPEPDKDEFYITDLLGMSAQSTEGHVIGKVAAVQNFGAGDLLEIDGPEGRFFVPFTLAAVPDIFLAEARLTIDLDQLDGEDGEPAPDA